VDGDTLRGVRNPQASRERIALPLSDVTQGGYPLAVAPIDAATVDTAYLDARVRRPFPRFRAR